MPKITRATGPSAYVEPEAVEPEAVEPEVVEPEVVEPEVVEPEPSKPKRPRVSGKASVPAPTVAIS